MMRIPDDKTRDALINEKLTSAKWSAHLGKAESFLVNSATWGLTFSKEFLRASNHASNNWLVGPWKKNWRVIYQRGSPSCYASVEQRVCLR